MAEVNSDDGGGKKKHGKQRAKKTSTRIDMTPMVDLGFLLLTFFILTTTLSKPMAMKLIMPKKDPLKENTNKVDDDHTLNILLTKNNVIYWYFGMADPTKGPLPALHRTNFSASGIRKILIEENNKRHKAYDYVKDLERQVKEGTLPDTSFTTKKNQFFQDVSRRASVLVVLIKPDKEAKYKNVVDLLDEVSIANVGVYALLEANGNEDLMIAEANKYVQ